MKARLLAAAIVAAVPMSFVGAPTASAVWCNEEGPRLGRDCCGGIVNDVWDKVFGSDLIYCLNG